MKVITYNIQTMFSNLFPTNEHYWLERMERMKEIETLNADILCLQESRRPQLWMLDEMQGYDRVGRHQCPLVTQHCGIYFRKDKYELLETRTHLLPDSRYRRMYTKAVLDGEGKRISVYNTHISWGEDGDKQFKMLSDIVLDDENFSILCGDLNAAGREKQSSLYFLDYEGGSFHGYHEEWGKNCDKIDYIFTNEPVEHETHSILNAVNSDHYPIIADIAL